MKNEKGFNQKMFLLFLVQVLLTALFLRDIFESSFGIIFGSVWFNIWLIISLFIVLSKNNFINKFTYFTFSAFNIGWLLINIFSVRWGFGNFEMFFEVLFTPILIFPFVFGGSLLLGIVINFFLKRRK